jgi:hypothetical protein
MSDPQLSNRPLYSQYRTAARKLGNRRVVTVNDTQCSDSMDCLPDASLKSAIIESAPLDDSDYFPPKAVVPRTLDLFYPAETSLSQGETVSRAAANVTDASSSGVTDAFQDLVLSESVPPPRL